MRQKEKDNKKGRPPQPPSFRNPPPLPREIPAHIIYFNRAHRVKKSLYFFQAIKTGALFHIDSLNNVLFSKCYNTSR